MSDELQNQLYPYVIQPLNECIDALHQHRAKGRPTASFDLIAFLENTLPHILDRTQEMSEDFRKKEQHLIVENFTLETVKTFLQMDWRIAQDDCDKEQDIINILTHQLDSLEQGLLHAQERSSLAQHAVDHAQVGAVALPTIFGGCGSVATACCLAFGGPMAVFTAGLPLEPTLLHESPESTETMHWLP